MSRGAAALFVALSAGSAGAQDPQPILLLDNGRFWTADPARPWVEAVAVQGDRILAVGDSALALPTPESRRIDLGGRLAVPGFIDTHTHFAEGSLGLVSIQLRDARTPEEFVSRIRDYAARLPRGAWVLHDGSWDHENWGGELPTRAWIDSVSAGHPVWIHRLDGHMALANSEALRIAGVTGATPDPEGGTIVRDASGEPTGILKDNAIALVSAKVPAPTTERLLQALEAGLAYARSEGVTSIHDICRNGDIPVFQRLAREGRLTLRVYCRQYLEHAPEVAASGITAASGDRWIKRGSVKAYRDGSLGSSTAAFFEPYVGEPENRGLEIQPKEELYEQLAAADRARLQLSVHAIGDRAISDVLDIFERIRAENPPWDRRWRIEHAQHIAPKDFARFADLEAIASMQPYHAIDDGRWAESRIGAERLKTTYAFRTLLDRGVRVTFGSDWYVAPLSPIQGIYAAVTRRTLDDMNPEGWVPEQKIKVEEALAAYTSEGAYTAFEEREKGRIAPGLLADFAVLERDLFEIPPEAIAEVRVAMTILGGEVVYQGAEGNATVEGGGGRDAGRPAVASLSEPGSARRSIAQREGEGYRAEDQR